MSDFKRVPFKTVETDLLKKPEKEAATGSKKCKSKTMRIELKLFEPTQDSFPEFNYKKMLHIEKKKQKKLEKTKVHNGNFMDENDPFAENDEDEVARIAKELEAKYGSGSAYERGQGRSKSDYDRGAGYDESDSFIDNTDAYDELIPDEVETDRGGFYINSGQLEFKKLSNFERPGDELRMPKPKKRILSSSSEEGSDSSSSDIEEETDTSKSKKKSHSEKKQKTQTASSSDDQGKPKKIKENVPKKDKEEDKPKEKPKKPEKSEEIANSVDLTKDKEKEKEKDKDKEKDKKVVKTTTIKDMLRIKRDQELKKIEREGKGATTTEDDTEHESSSEILESSDDLEKNEHRENGVLTKNIKLPDNLSLELQKHLNALKQIIDEAGGTNINKHNFFDANISDLFLKIDSEARNGGQNVKCQVYSYLEKILPYSKQSLVTKVKKLKLQIVERKERGELVKFKGMIADLMPSAIAKYESDCAHVSNMKKISTIVGVEESQQNLKMPRKKFPWNDNLRNSFFDLIKMRQDYYKVLKSRKETFEEFIEKYLKEIIVPIWPQGWIKYEDLTKELDRRKKKEEKGSISSTNTPTQKTAKIVDVNSNKSSVLNTSVSDIPASTSATATATTSVTTVLQQSLSKCVEKTEIDIDIPAACIKKIQNDVTVITIDTSEKSGKVEKVEKTYPDVNKLAAINRIHNKANMSVENSTKVTSSSSNSVKKSSDHSISSIISSSPTTTLAVGNVAHQSQSSKEKVRPVVMDDKYANAKHLNTNNHVNSQNQKDSKIKVRTNMMEPNSNQIPPVKNVVSTQKSVIKSTASAIREEDSSDSDCVEIVGVFKQAAPTSSTSARTDSITPEALKKNKEKQRMLNNSSSNNNNSSLNMETNAAPPPKKKKIDGVDDETEIDVHKIMSDLMKLHEFKPQPNKKFSSTETFKNTMTPSSGSSQLPPQPQIKQQGILSNHSNAKNDDANEHKSTSNNNIINNNSNHNNTSNNNVHYSINDILTSNSSIISNRTVLNVNSNSNNSNSVVKNNNAQSEYIQNSLHNNQKMQQQQQQQQQSNYQSVPLSLTSSTLTSRSSPMSPAIGGIHLSQVENLNKSLHMQKQPPNSSNYTIPSILNLTTNKYKKFLNLGVHKDN